MNFIQNNYNLTSFDCTHYTFFKNHIGLILDSHFLEIIDGVNKLFEIPISDPTHLIKCAKSRLLQQLLPLVFFIHVNM